MATRVEGLERLRAKVLGRLTQAAKAEMKAANQKSADEFAAAVRLALPKGDAEDGHLADTLEVKDSAKSETGVEVSLGDADHPYPFHLEGGHRNKDGSHTPAKPTWNPAKRAVAKRAKSRGQRAANKVIKGLTQP